MGGWSWFGAIAFTKWFCWTVKWAGIFVVITAAVLTAVIFAYADYWLFCRRDKGRQGKQ